MAAKRKPGRPTKYRKEFCRTVPEFMADGYSVKAAAAHVGTHYATMYVWAKEHPEFYDALKEGQALSAQWWEKALRKTALTGEGSAAAAIFGVKNRSQEEWRDKVENDHTSSDGSMTPVAGIDIKIIGDDAAQD